MSREQLVKFKFVSSFVAMALIAITGFLFARTAQAATLYLAPSSTSVTVGDLVTIKLFVDTQGKTINNAEGIIQFPASFVEAASINSKNSIFSLWVEQPNFSNTAGWVSFNGGIPNPGYTGNSGEVLSVIFRAKKAGTASFLFGSAAVRENDGLGTDILTGQLSTSVNITSAVPEPTKAPVPPVLSLLEPPVIYSPVYVDQNSWYSAKAGIITWTLPSAGATAVQTFFNNIPDSTPSINYKPPIYQKEIKNLTDGVWYFHLRYSAGDNWSPITHYKIQIDSQQPDSLTVTPIKNSDGTVSLKLEATDALSGIDYYNIVIDSQPAIKVSAQSAQSPVLLPRLNIGSHQILVSVYDKAGNKKEEAIQIIIDSTTAPVIDRYTKEIKVGEKIVLSGSSIYPRANMKVVIKPEFGDEAAYDLVTDKNGNFSFVSAPMDLPGNYQIWVYIPGPDGLVSAISAKQDLVVKQSMWDVVINKLLSIRIPYSRDIIVSVAIWLLIALVALIGWYKYFVLRRRFKLIEQKADRAFILLAKRARKKIAALDKLQKKEGPNPEEKKALSELKEIVEEIENIKKSESK